MKKQKLVWRLGKLPSTEELRELVKDKIITQEEAREILFSLDDETDRDTDSFMAEVTFLRKLVEKLSNDRAQLVTTIREVETPYKRYPWYGPYYAWCGTTDLTYATSGTVTLGVTDATTNGTTMMGTTNTSTNFSDITTF